MDCSEALISCFLNKAGEEKGNRRENGRLALAVVTLIHLLSHIRLNNFFCDSALGPSKTNNTLCSWWATSNLTAILMESIIRERGRNNGRAPHLLITVRAIKTHCDHQTSSFFKMYFLFLSFQEQRNILMSSLSCIPASTNLLSFSVGWAKGKWRLV